MGFIARFIGGFIAIFVGIPAVLAIAWAFGTTDAALSDEFYADLAENGVEQIPSLIEKSLAAAGDPELVADPTARAWLDAMSKSATPLPQALETAGVYAWMRGDVTNGLRNLSRIVRGEADPEDLEIDMRPLKKALVSPALGSYVKDVMAQLPPCSDRELDLWASHARDPRTQEPVPACNPGADAVSQGLQFIAASVTQIPDELRLVESPGALPPVDVVRTFSAFRWLLFLPPLLIVFIAAGLAGRGKKGFLRWTGGTISSGGLLGLLTSSLAGTWFVPLVRWGPGTLVTKEEAALWSSEAGKVFAAELADMMDVFLSPLFSRVTWVAVGITAVGAVFLLLGAFARRPSAPAGGQQAIADAPAP